MDIPTIVIKAYAVIVLITLIIGYVKISWHIFDMEEQDET